MLLLHPPPPEVVGITVYTTTAFTELLVLCKVAVIDAVPPALATGVIVPLVTLLKPQVKVDRPEVDDKGILNKRSLQEVPVKLLLFSPGDGLTLTVIVDKGPTQEPIAEVGVTEYNTTPASELLGLMSV